MVVFVIKDRHIRETIIGVIEIMKIKMLIIIIIEASLAIIATIQIIVLEMRQNLMIFAFITLSSEQMLINVISRVIIKKTKRPASESIN